MIVENYNNIMYHRIGDEIATHEKNGASSIGITGKRKMEVESENNSCLLLLDYV